MNFAEKGLGLTAEEMIALLDVMMQRAVKCRHYDSVIPCIPRIFTTNLECRGSAHPFVSGNGAEQQAAIERRFIQYPYIREWMFKEPRREEVKAEELLW